MSDLLSRRLHEATDRLPTAPRGPVAVRRAAGLRQRRVRAGTATLTAIAVLSAGSAVAWLEGDGPVAPDMPAVTSTPTSPVTLGRFLLPSDLPVGGPFVGWEDRSDTRDMVGQPTCTTMVKGEPVQSRLVEFTSSTAGTRGYQSVAVYPTIDVATSVQRAHLGALAACGKRLDDTADVVQLAPGGYDGFQILNRPGLPGDLELTVYARAGRMVSVVWLTAPSDVRLSAGTALNLLSRTSSRLAGTPPQRPGTDVAAEDPLAAAMLQSGDVSGGSAKYDDVTASAPERNGVLPSVAHPCGRPSHSDNVLVKTFTVNQSDVLVLQRLLVAADLRQARGTARALYPGGRGCALGVTTVVERADGVGETLLTYGAVVERDQEATVRVAILQVGTVVSEIVLVDRRDDGVDHGRFLTPLVETAIDRIRTALPADSLSGRS